MSALKTVKLNDIKFILRVNNKVNSVGATRLIVKIKNCNAIDHAFMEKVRELACEHYGFYTTLDVEQEYQDGNQWP